MLICLGPGSTYSPDGTSMYMDGQQMMRAQGITTPSWTTFFHYSFIRAAVAGLFQTEETPSA